MVFLQRKTAFNPRKRSAAGAPLHPDPSPRLPPSSTNPNAAAAAAAAADPCSDDCNLSETTIPVLAEAGCTLRPSPGGPPSLLVAPQNLRRRLDSRFCSDPSLVPRFLSGFSSYVRNPSCLRLVLASFFTHHGAPAPAGENLVRCLLLVPQLQLPLQKLLLEKIPEHFDSAAGESIPIKDDIARLIINQFRWLDFLVDPNEFVEKLMEVLYICPSRLKKEIIGSLPEIVGDQGHGSVVAALRNMLQEDSEIVVSVLDSFSSLNLDEQLLEQAITIALSCIRTIEGEHIPHLLRFLLLSATPANAGSIITQIRGQLKFVGAAAPCASRNKKLKGKSLTCATDSAILESLQSCLHFKNILREVVLKELKNLDQPRQWKVIDVWLLILLYKNSGVIQKSVEKLLRKKIVEGCLNQNVIDECILGHRMLVKEYFSSFLSVCEYLVTCREKKARDFGTDIYLKFFKEFSDLYSRQEVLGALVTHIGSGVAYEVSSALDAMVLLSSKHSSELLPVSSHISGILDYLEGFHEENLYKVYAIFSHLALASRSNSESMVSSIVSELLMLVRKQVGNPDIKYKKMGIIGTLQVVSILGDAEVAENISSYQKSNWEEALELLKMAIEYNKLVTLPLILLYDELIVLLEHKRFHPMIIEWIWKHAGEFESLFLMDLEEGQLPLKDISNVMEGELWMNLDGRLSPICLNIMSLISSSLEQPCSLEILPSQFLLLSFVERLTNQGSLGGIDALLGCPLYLPSHKLLVRANFAKMTEKQKEIVCFSLYYAINWIRELLNAFTTQATRELGCISQDVRSETMVKILKRLRNLVFMEALLNSCLEFCPCALPELHHMMGNHGSPGGTSNCAKRREKTVQFSNRRKHKRDSVTSEKLGPYGNLKQLTIVESMNKAGVFRSQECQNGTSSGIPTIKNTSQNSGFVADSHDPDFVDICAVPKVLRAQIFKFRPLRVDIFLVLSFSDINIRNNCCPDPAAELPLHLYILRDLHSKLDGLNPPKRGFPTTSEDRSGYCRMDTSQFLNRIRPLFVSLRKHLDAALSVLKDGCECREHWTSRSASAGNPEIPYLVVSKSSVACSIIREVLYCFSKMLCLPELFLQNNSLILTEMLQAFLPVVDSNQLLLQLQPSPTPGSIEYLYCSVFLLIESILDTACISSFFLASEVLVSLQSFIFSVTMFTDKSVEGNRKNAHMGSVISFLQSRLASAAKKLLANDWDHDDNKDEMKSKGDTLQKILQIYLKNNDSPDLLNKLACVILPQVPPCKSKDAPEVSHEFPTLRPSMFLTWYRVLHEENINTLNKLVEEVFSKSKMNLSGEDVNRALFNLHQTVTIVVSLVNICKLHDKVPVFAIAVKYGGTYVDIFLKAFNFLQLHFVEFNDLVIQMLKELQKATRIIQALCCEAKGLRSTMVTNKVPATKRSMERFVFHVKALLHNTSNGHSFWMGNLKHKDLHGQVVSSQAYNDGGDGVEGEAEPPNLGEDIVDVLNGCVT